MPLPQAVYVTFVELVCGSSLVVLQDQGLVVALHAPANARVGFELTQADVQMEDIARRHSLLEQKEWVSRNHLQTLTTGSHLGPFASAPGAH